MNNKVNVRFYEKYAWAVFLIIGVMVIAGGLPHAFGFNTDPALVKNISGKTIDDLKASSPPIFNLYNFYFSGGGLSDLGFAFFLVAIALTAYRKGQKWAWYAFWFVPAYFLAWIVLSLTLPPAARSSLFPPLVIIIVLSLAGLLLPFRKFFPKKEMKL